MIMCIVCALWEKDKLTNKEAKAALYEMVENKDVTDEHIEEAWFRINEKEEKDNE
jgi:hypothetical protein